MNEWEFTSEVVSWINELLLKNPSFPFSRAKTEQQGKGSRQRRDITLLDKNQRPVLTGDIKLPYAKDGNSPHNDAVVQDARSKAQRAGSPFFFTWNVNECILWETSVERPYKQSQKYKSWRVTSVHSENHLDIAPTHQAIKSWLATFLKDFASILRGAASLGEKPPDEHFIELLESYLSLPIRLTFEELLLKYKIAHFKRDLDAWMRDEQGWTILDDEEGIKENLERAAKFSCYALVNKLVFHEALLKRYGSQMDSLSVAEHIDTGEGLRDHLNYYFGRAKIVTGDYETVFGEDHREFGNRIPFVSDYAVPHWRDLINKIHKFDFSKLDYEVIGCIFERLISPEERHKYGQFYTRVEVVDLINSFCIRTGNEKVMDPACGGGTFLVRAYVRKRELSPYNQHGQILSDLYGVDISHFATHLTTINLATRNLVNEENYPQIARSDYFDILTHKPFLTLPKGFGSKQHRKIEIPLLDAVIGNPPYVRQEDIRKDIKKKGKHSPSPGTKEYYRKKIAEESGITLSGRSDLHIYFWPHSKTFLKDDGYLCLLTSSQWLDVEYGFRLQAWILSNFRIVAVLESVDEPWFVGARVATTVTILQRENDESARMNNCVRFVQLRRPVNEILVHDGTTADAMNAEDRFRDELLATEENTVTERYRLRLVSQKTLWNAGVELSSMMGKSGQDDDSDNETEDSEEPIQTGVYYGGKWGVYLRAPDLWFSILDECSQKFDPLGRITEIHRGITTGKDVFFFPKDISEECLNAVRDNAEFRHRYGASRREVENDVVKLVRCGEGRERVFPIEARYLEPEVHSLMEIDGFTVSPENCSRMILLVGEKKEQLRGTYVLKYIQWGEKEKYHTGSTCAARVTESREWYDLTGHNRGSFFWPMAQQYKHIIAENVNNLICNHNLFDISMIDDNQLVLGGIFNSSWVVLSKFQYGRPVGVEGNLKTEVIDTKMMLIPNPDKASSASLARIAKAFEVMKKRKALMFLPERRLREMSFIKAGRQDELASLSHESELDMPDRRELDDAVLEMLGIDSPERRKKLNEELYSHLRDFFETTRQKEEKAIVNKITSKRRGPARPQDIALQIFQEITENEPELLHQYDPHFLNTAEPFDTFDIPEEGIAELYSDMFIEYGVKFVNGTKSKPNLMTVHLKSQAELIVLIASSDGRGLVRIPHDDTEVKRVFREYETFVRSRDDRIQEYIAERTADEDVQDKIHSSLMMLITHH